MKIIRFIATILLAIIMASCSSAKRTTYHDVSSKLETQFNIYKGIPYKYGGITKRGFDCSGYVQIVYQNAFGIQLPRATKNMSKVGRKIKKNKLIPGDLVFFKPKRKYEHVGIYMGNNLFMHSSTSKGIIKSNMNNPYWKKKYRFAKRILKIK